MKTSTMCFWLRTALIACLCGAAVFLGAYTAGAWNLQMLLTPLLVLLAHAACKAEQTLRAQARARRAAARRMRVDRTARAAANAVQAAPPGGTGSSYAHACGDEIVENEYFAAKSRKAS